MDTDIDIEEYCRDIAELDRRSVQKNGLSFIFNIILQKKTAIYYSFFGYVDKMIKVKY